MPFFRTFGYARSLLALVRGRFHPKGSVGVQARVRWHCPQTSVVPAQALVRPTLEVGYCLPLRPRLPTSDWWCNTGKMVGLAMLPRFLLEHDLN